MGALKELMKAKGPAEMLALVRYSRRASAARTIMTAALDPNWQYAYNALCNVSRSFALVIMQLHVDLRHPICVFYLILRALDTIEDDTSASPIIRRRLCTAFWTALPTPQQSLPVQSLSSSSTSTISTTSSSSSNPNTSTRRRRALCLADDGEFVDAKDVQPIPEEDRDFTLASTTNASEWSSSDFGSGAEKELCQRFPEVIACFRDLQPNFQHIIINITRRMGKGMADHITSVACDSLHDYDLYCHYVAGLVGLGLSEIFVQSRREHVSLSDHNLLSNSMGLFLQKTNIIRDYLEDITEGRTFWPREIWSQYADRLEDFRESGNRKFALGALNHMVTDALRHAPHCLEYMSRIRSDDVFNFVAIPQVMAIATLAECYNNGKVFEGVVKLRRARTAQLVLQTRDIDAVYKLFFEYAQSMLRKVEAHDPSAEATRDLLNSVIDTCVPHVPAAPNLIIPNMVSIVFFCGLSSYVLKRRQEHFDGAVFTWRSAGGIMEPSDMAAVGALFIVCMYMFAFFLLPYMTKLQQEEYRLLQREERAHGERHVVEPRVVELE